MAVLRRLQDQHDQRDKRQAQVETMELQIKEIQTMIAMMIHSFNLQAKIDQNEVHAAL